jgi:ABC-type transport system involved in multi-copper enzyme maturation permease subunit
MGAGPVTATTTAVRSAGDVARGGFGSALRAEWTKFRTVRGWVIGLLVAALLCIVFTFLVANGNHTGSCTGTGTTCQSGHPFVPTGPGGEPVADSYQYFDQSLTGDGTLTVQITSLTGRISTNPPDAAPSISASRPGLAEWAKAGILLTPTTTQGSSYAAVTATAGHGLRFQSDYTHDQGGLPATITSASGRWLRLTRTGDTITGYQSTNGTTWHKLGTTHLAGLSRTVDVGLFVTSPVTYQDSLGGVPTQATATFDHLTLNGNAQINGWQSHNVGANDYYPKLGSGSARRSGLGVVLSGSGDIAPAVNLSVLGGNTASSTLPFGIVVALIVLIVVATMFITAEYRRGLIRTTLTATPQRGSVLAAKALVIGIVAFVIGAVAAAIAIPLGIHALGSGGNYVFPASALTRVGVIAGTGAIAALTAVGVLGLGTILRSSAAAVTAGIVVFVLPTFLGPGILGPASSGSSGGSAMAWLYQFTPAAGLSVLGVLPRSSVVDFPFTLANGYYPLSALAGLAVLAAYSAVALALAAYLLRRRDA